MPFDADIGAGFIGESALAGGAEKSLNPKGSGAGA